jgi:hypothetical protein
MVISLGDIMGEAKTTNSRLTVSRPCRKNLFFHRAQDTFQTWSMEFSGSSIHNLTPTIDKYKKLDLKTEKFIP